MTAEVALAALERAREAAPRATRLVVAEAAAVELGLSARSLYRRIREWGLRVPPPVKPLRERVRGRGRPRRVRELAPLELGVERVAVTAGVTRSRAESGGLLWERICQAEGEWDGVLPPLSPWWRGALEGWLRGEARQLVCRVGRRGGKSSTLSRWALAEALWGEHVVPDGDVGVVAVISVERRDAIDRLRTIAALLERIGYRATTGKPRREREYVMRQSPTTEIVLWGPSGIRIVRTHTASVRGVSGITCIGVLCDEVSKWRDEDTEKNPAAEVLASVRPTMATQPNARIVLSSSPWSTIDAHHEAFALGDTPNQIVVHAPTWIANPTISELQTRLDEPDEILWEREYAAVPMPAVMERLYDPGAVERCMGEVNA